jgi:uncharacterized membrane protein
VVKRWFCVSLILLLVIMGGWQVQARSHRFVDLEIDARVGADGLVRVSEIHTVQFDGTFTGMYQWLNTQRDIQVRDVEVLEEGVPYTRLEAEAPGPTGTFFVQDKGDQLHIDWSFEATDEIRRFELRYVLDNIILKHKDAAEFYYQFVGSYWDQPRDHVRIVLSLPTGAAADQVAAWGYGPSQGTVDIVSPSQIVWEVENLKERTFVEGRVIFPNELVPLGTRYTNQNRLEEIIREEEGRALSRERRAKLQGIDPYAAAGVFTLAYLCVLFIWRRFGPPKTGYTDRYYKELPAKYPPAEMSILYRRTIDGRDLTATLLDLARRGFLKIEEVVGLQGKGSGRESSYKFIQESVSTEQLMGLQPYETRVLELLFQDLKGKAVTLEDLQSYAKDQPKAFSAFWSAWVKDIKDAAEGRDFFDPNAKGVLWLLLPSISLLFLALFPFAYGMYFTGTVSLVMGLALTIVVGVASGRRSERGHEEYTKWKAFRRYLKESSRVETARVGSLGIWETFLPYAVALGVADPMLKQLEVRFPRLEQDGYAFGSHWFIYYQTAGMYRVSHMTHMVEKSVTQMTVSQLSGGTGGGFSGGGGGGFGGGGGGVR